MQSNNDELKMKSTVALLCYIDISYSNSYLTLSMILIFIFLLT